MKHYFKQAFDYVFKEAYESSSALSHEFLKTNKSFDYKLMLSFLVAAVCLSLFSYFGDLDFARQSLQNWGLNSIANALSKLSQTANDPYLFTLRFWSYSSLVCYFLIPAAFIKLVLKQSLKTYGLSFRSFLEDWKIYLTIYVFMFFAMFAASFLPSFQTLYPYYDPEPLFPNFLIWQLHYIGVFFATEFFFRGFLIHGFKQRFGFYSVFIAMLPYCMVHFGKPIEENPRLNRCRHCLRGTQPKNQIHLVRCIHSLQHWPNHGPTSTLATRISISLHFFHDSQAAILIKARVL